jgi:hypothetical protein
MAVAKPVRPPTRERTFLWRGVAMALKMAARNRAIRKFQINPTNSAEIASVARATANMPGRIRSSSIGIPE